MRMFVKLVLLITFGAFFKNFFNGFEISMKFCVFECISTDQPDKDQCSKHQRYADQRLSTSTKIG
jgi:hypothetical protein